MVVSLLLAMCGGQPLAGNRFHQPLDSVPAGRVPGQQRPQGVQGPDHRKRASQPHLLNGPPHFLQQAPPPADRSLAAVHRFGADATPRAP
jgi:hypothetical protein